MAGLKDMHVQILLACRKCALPRSQYKGTGPGVCSSAGAMKDGDAGGLVIRRLASMRVDRVSVDRVVHYEVTAVVA